MNPIDRLKLIQSIVAEEIMERELNDPDGTHVAQGYVNSLW